MMSDQEFAWLKGQYWPRVEQLEALQATPTSARRAAQAAALIGELDAWVERLPLLQAHYAALRAPWQADLARQAQRRQVLRLNWAILIFFVLVALIGGLYTRDWALASLLSLPVAGWYWLGVHRLKRPRP
jgi:hypothetical protein